VEISADKQDWLQNRAAAIRNVTAPELRRRSTLMTSSLSVSTGARSTCAYVNDTKPQMPTNAPTLNPQFCSYSSIFLLIALPKTAVLYRLYRLRDPVNFTVLFMFHTQVFFFFFPWKTYGSVISMILGYGLGISEGEVHFPLYQSQLPTHFTPETLNNVTTVS
jgi:hypothetical protein